MGRGSILTECDSKKRNKGANNGMYNHIPEYESRSVQPYSL